MPRPTVLPRIRRTRGTRVTNAYWQTAAKVCTPKELDTLHLRERGLSLRQIALATGVSLATIRNRLFNADRKIELALRPKDAA